MPKAPALASAEEFDGDNDNEKTTLESGWEDEPSTTIEQGEVAEKIRSMVNEPARRSITNVTNTNGAGLDEPTVDDQRAKAELSMITPAIARLLITQGNDTGQQLEIKPGKSYTIGRGIDNDFVLTDIAVSRKHFDLRHEAGEWVVADRGSGNGTVVNGAIEDQPFVLANGDTIEIGNTTFRFDHPNGAARHSLNSTFDLDGEESSTVAGKPIRDDIATPAQRLAPLPPLRAKTIPPPAPLPRPRAPSAAPGYGYGAQGSIPPPNLPLPTPASTMPLPSTANGGNRAPVLGAQQPTLLGDSSGLRSHMQASQNGVAPLANKLPTTLPGQGPNQLHHHNFGYPSASDMPHQHVQIAQLNGNPRDATSTALVQPSPYAVGAMSGASQYVAPQLSRRTKLALGGAALALFAAISTIAIIKNTSKPPAPAKSPGKSSAPMVEPIDDDRATAPAPVTPSAAPTSATKPTPSVATKPTTVASTTPPTTAPA
ncbi:MAG: FHA domain-containing protein, partial [Myxococcota bacterium]|nr:FHA domain-containing protein [Myxococcota bacterium]